MDEYLDFDITVYKCHTPYIGFMNLNVGDDFRLFVHRDINGTPLFVWGAKMDCVKKQLRHIIFLDHLSGNYPMINDWSGMIACCNPLSERPGYIQVYPFTVYRSIKSEVRFSKLTAMFTLIREN